MPCKLLTIPAGWFNSRAESEEWTRSDSFSAPWLSVLAFRQHYSSDSPPQTNPLIHREMRTDMNCEAFRAGLQAERGQVGVPHLVLSADYHSGHRGAAAGASEQAALDDSLAACREGGGECERIYGLDIGNSTDVSVTVKLYQPNEADLSDSNSLFSWTVPPYNNIRLSIQHGDPVLVNKRFILKIAAADGFERWGPKPLQYFKSEASNDSEGDRLTIRVAENLAVGEQHLYRSYGLNPSGPEDRTRLFQILLKNAERWTCCPILARCAL